MTTRSAGAGVVRAARPAATAILWEAGRRWADDRCDRLAAALSCYALFSLFPLALLCLTAVGYLLGDAPSTRQGLVRELAVTGSPELNVLLDQTLSNMQAHRGARGVGIAVGIVTALLGASGVFAELQNAFLVIWRVPPPPSVGLWGVLVGLVRGKAVAIGLVGLAALFLLGSLVVSTVVGAASDGSSAWATVLWSLVEPALSAVVLWPVMALLFRVLLGRHILGRDLAFGAAWTALLFSILKKTLAYYLAHVVSYAAYGLAGAVLGFLTWIYVSSMLLFYGLEVTRVRAEIRESTGPGPGRGSLRTERSST